jgi:hypothetical protein
MHDTFQLHGERITGHTEVSEAVVAFSGRNFRIADYTPIARSYTADMPIFRVRITLFLWALTLLPMLAFSQSSAPTEQVCDVVDTPLRFDHKTIELEGILSPSDHSLGLYGLACIPTEDHNVSVEAILSPSWENTEAGRKLRSILKRRRNARVRLIGTFESTGGPYGPDSARFRFTIAQVLSAEKVEPLPAVR